MSKQALFSSIQQKKSFLCVGLDTDIQKIPAHLRGEEDPIFAFNKAIIDATHEYAVSYKLNTAFYEAQGAKGWLSMEKTLNYIPEGILCIADAKRGDIGNTSALYARAFFEQMDFDAITVAPYMGKDSVSPFLGFANKWVIVLGLTSNAGSEDFQALTLEKGTRLYEEVIAKVATWANEDSLMFVVGATKAESLGDLRKLIPGHFLLVPGVGAQGGDLGSVARYGMNSHCGLLVNSSREIIYASNGTDFAEAAGQKAKALQEAMQALLQEKGLL